MFKATIESPCTLTAQPFARNAIKFNTKKMQRNTLDFSRLSPIEHFSSSFSFQTMFVFFHLRTFHQVDVCVCGLSRVVCHWYIFSSGHDIARLKPWNEIKANKNQNHGMSYSSGTEKKCASNEIIVMITAKKDERENISQFRWNWRKTVGEMANEAQPDETN